MADQTTALDQDFDGDYDESRDGFHRLMDSVHLDETFIDPLIDADRLRTLRLVLAAIEDPKERAGGVGWETARDIVQRIIDASPADGNPEPCGEDDCRCNCIPGMPLHPCSCHCPREPEED